MELNKSIDNDSTAVIRMREHFADFLSNKSLRSVTGNDQESLDDDDTQCRRLDFSNLSDNTTSTFPIRIPSVGENDRKVVAISSELQNAKSAITQLQTKLTTVECARKRARTELESELEVVRKNCEQEQNKYDELAIQFKFVKERGERYAELLKSEKEDHKETVSRLQDEMKTSLKGKELAIKQLQNDKEKLQEKIYQLSSQFSDMQSDAYSAHSQVQNMKLQCDADLRRKSEECRKTCNEYEAEIARCKHRVEELEEKLLSSEEDNKVTLMMKSQLASLPVLETENSKLREENANLRERQENTFLLKEKFEGANNKCLRLEERCSQLSRVEVENAELKRKIEALEQSGRSFQTPHELNKQVAELQNNEITMLEKIGQLQSSLSIVEESLKLSKDEHKQVDISSKQHQAKTQQQADLIRRLQRKLLLITKERDGYKRIIDSYESEVTVSLDTQTLSRVQQQDDVIQGYQRQLELAETEMQQQAAELSNYKSKCQQLQLESKTPVSAESSASDQKTISALREKVASLEVALDKVQQEKDVLEARLEQRHLQGDYDPTKTKVLHFAHNPAALAQKAKMNELGRLKEENEKLKERVKLLEENQGAVEDLTVKVEHNVRESGSADSQELKKQLETAELKNKRLMEAFKKTSQDFRSTVYQLTGYQINIKTNNQFQLMSMYAESADDVLLFQQGKHGGMQLLETDFSSTMSSHVDLYLRRHDSIPCFLSNITLDLFGRQTMQI